MARSTGVDDCTGGTPPAEAVMDPVITVRGYCCVGRGCSGHSRRVDRCPGKPGMASYAAVLDLLGIGVVLLVGCGCSLARRGLRGPTIEVVRRSGGLGSGRTRGVWTPRALVRRDHGRSGLRHGDDRHVPVDAGPAVSMAMVGHRSGIRRRPAPHGGVDGPTEPPEDPAAARVTPGRFRGFGRSAVAGLIDGARRSPGKLRGIPEGLRPRSVLSCRP